VDRKAGSLASTVGHGIARCSGVLGVLARTATADFILDDELLTQNKLIKAPDGFAPAFGSRRSQSIIGRLRPAHFGSSGDYGATT